jgi:hypothetical protein
MYQESQLKTYIKHLKKRHDRLLERSNSYRIIDETISDVAAFKAMKIQKKLNQLSYLSN